MDRLFDTVEVSIFGPPPKPGVYAICVAWPKTYGKTTKERIIYIGSSKNMLKRLMAPSHYYRQCYDRFDEILVYTKTIPTDEYLPLERELIRLYRPLLNKQWRNG